MKRALVCVVLGALALCGCARRAAQSSRGFDWPCWAGPDRNWLSRETDWDPKALAGGPRVLWKADVGYGYSNVAIRDGLLYVNARSGKLRWRKDLVSEYGAVKPYYGFAGSPVVVGDLLVLNVNTSGICLRKSNGRLVWGSEAPPAARILEQTVDDNGATYMTPVPYDAGGKPRALVYSWKGLFSVDIGSGQPTWSYEWENYNLCKTPDPVLLGDRVFIADENSTILRDRFCTLLEISDRTPAVVWKSQDLFSDVGTPIVLDGYVYDSYGGPYSVSATTTLRCLNLETGRLMWEETVVEPGGEVLWLHWISVSAAADNLIVLTDRGILYIAEASPEGFKVLSSCDVLEGVRKSRKFCTPPVLCNGRIYCRNFAGDLICIDVSG